MNDTAVVPKVSIVDELVKLEKPFSTQNAYALNFHQECLFARQQLVKSDSTLKTATNNPMSLRSAILNVPAIGLSLNPALAHCYLVPRAGAICLDISYRGLVKLATDSGAIQFAKAVLVYEGDTFEWRGPVEQPLHTADVFDANRIDAADPLKKLRGGYCLAKLADGTFMVDVMSAAEILEVRDSSKAKDGPWKGRWSGEMAKKTLVKRASKSWPQSGGRERLDRAVEILNEHEGLEDAPVVARQSDYLRPTPEQTATYLELAKGDSVDFWLWYRAQDERVKVSLPGCEFEHGKKQATMKMFNNLLEDGRVRFGAWVTDLAAMCEQGDDHGVLEFISEFEGNQYLALLDALSVQHQGYVLSLRAAA